MSEDRLVAQGQVLDAIQSGSAAVNFGKAFEAVQHAVEKKRPSFLYVVLAFMAVMVMIEEFLAHRYDVADGIEPFATLCFV